MCPVQISLGRLVRETRKYLKLTQSQLALATNVGSIRKIKTNSLFLD
jgi:transcriptional regulator with XRE-family HTH domain